MHKKAMAEFPRAPCVIQELHQSTEKLLAAILIIHYMSD